MKQIKIYLNDHLNGRNYRIHGLVFYCGSSLSCLSSLMNWDFLSLTWLTLAICNTNQVYLYSLCALKELEHIKLGWKVLILKYDLGNSLNKEMWCKMADTKNFFDYIVLKMKNACNMR